MNSLRIFFLTCALALPGLLPAQDLRLGTPFTSHMVLQRDQPILIWGWAPPLWKGTVTFAGKSETFTTYKTGKWQVELPAQAANARGQTLTISGTGLPTITLTDVLVGEVWLASGQSNMQWTVSGARKEDQAMAAEQARDSIRLLTIPRKLAAYPQETAEAAWTSATAESVKDFSAVAFFFADALQRELGVPVGIINSSWGGSRSEPWTTLEGFAAVPELSELHARRSARTPGAPGYKKTEAAYLDAVAQWLEQSRQLHGKSLPLPPLPEPQTLALGHNQELGLYQAMIHPLVPFRVRGFLWYQGESNLGDGLAYEHKMQALIRGWRKAWNLPEAPFLFAQLAPFRYGRNTPDQLPKVWEAQLRTLAEPHTGMAVLTDIGNAKDIHPRNKSEVGRRLSLWALANTYGKDLVYSGPLFDKAVADGKSLRVAFKHPAEGLKTRDGKAPSHFEIAGNDGAFKPAEATISDDGQSVLLTSPEVPAPTQARFAWDDVADPNLVNSAGLPASPFHSE